VNNPISLRLASGLEANPNFYRCVRLHRIDGDTVRRNHMRVKFLKWTKLSQKFNLDTVFGSDFLVVRKRKSVSCAILHRVKLQTRPVEDTL
jgi:hypothetical protein